MNLFDFLCFLIKKWKLEGNNLAKVSVQVELSVQVWLQRTRHFHQTENNYKLRTEVPTEELPPDVWNADQH